MQMWYSSMAMCMSLAFIILALALYKNSTKLPS